MVRRARSNGATWWTLCGGGGRGGEKLFWFGKLWLLRFLSENGLIDVSEYR